MTTIGVLALQGDVAEHLRVLDRIGAHGIPVKHAAQLGDVDGLVIPGGESTTIGKLLDRFGLLEPLRAAIADGLGVFGTCAGAILLARTVHHHDGRESDQVGLRVMDAVVRRNAFGRQIDSFEADLDVDGVDGPPVRAVFIRAPVIEAVGPDVEVLATVPSRAEDDVDPASDAASGDSIVVCRQGRLLASSFHPELTDDPRLHELFVEMVR